MSLDRVQRRALALDAAITFNARGDRRSVLDTADAFDAWLIQQPPVNTFTITADPPRDRPTQEGTDVSLTFQDTQEVTLHVAGVVDSEGETVSDTFTWSVDVADVLTLTPSDDTMSCLATPATTSGTAVVTATASDGVARTFAIDVTTGPTAGFEITADEPVDRPAPEPTA